MKKLLFLAGIAVLFNFNLFSQQLPNGGFENWSGRTINNPDGFWSSNIMVADSGNVIKTTDAFHGSFAAKLVTVPNGNQPTQGMILIGTPGNQTINGGIPFNEVPDSISGYVKYDVQPNDTAFFVVAFKKNGTFISQCLKTFTGLHSTYVRFSIPTYLSSANPPDSMVAIISSSNLNQPQIAGSTLTIDSISFINSSQPFPNGDFENWTAVPTGEDPNGWGTYANQFPYYNLPVLVTKTVDAHSGNYAVKLVSDTGTVQPPFGSGIPGDTILGTLQLNLINGFASTKYPFPYRPDSLVGFVKGTVAAASNNFNLIWVQLSNNNNVIGQAAYSMNSSNSVYTRFAVNFSYSSGLIPDSMQFYILAGNPGNPQPGNIFYVDDLSLIYNPNSVNTIADKATLFVYPNPVSTNIFVSENALRIEIFNMNGQKVAEYANTNKANVADLPKGTYMVKVVTNNDVSVREISIVH